MPNNQELIINDTTIEKPSQKTFFGQVEHHILRSKNVLLDPEEQAVSIYNIMLENKQNKGQDLAEKTKKLYKKIKIFF